MWSLLCSYCRSWAKCLGAQLGRAKPSLGVPEENRRKFFIFSFLKTLQMHQILKYFFSPGAFWVFFQMANKIPWRPLRTGLLPLTTALVFIIHSLNNSQCRNCRPDPYGKSQEGPTTWEVKQVARYYFDETLECKWSSSNWSKYKQLTKQDIYNHHQNLRHIQFKITGDSFILIGLRPQQLWLQK